MAIFPNSRQIHFAIFLSAVGAMMVAYCFEYAMGLKPCPLCLSQRAVVIIIGLISMISYFHQPSDRVKKWYSVGLGFFALTGIALAGRQLYLQSLPPDKVPACMPDLSYLMDVLPFTEFLSVILNGTGDCAKVTWTFLGRSIAFWTFFMFTGYLSLSVLTFIRAKQEARQSIVEQ